MFKLLFLDHITQGRYTEAMREWGENVLPWAAATYWDCFITNLVHADRLDLIVKWLPFNDRGKVLALAPMICMPVM